MPIKSPAIDCVSDKVVEAAQTISQVTERRSATLASSMWQMSLQRESASRGAEMAHAVTPFLMFDGTAEKAITFYISLFKGSKVTCIERYGRGESGTEGSIKRAIFTLCDQELICSDSR